MARTKPQEFDKLILNGKSLKKNDKVINLKKREVIKYFASKVRPFSNSGAYIPCSEEYKHHNVYVIVLENKK